MYNEVLHVTTPLLVQPSVWLMVVLRNCLMQLSQGCRYNGGVYANHMECYNHCLYLF